MKFSILQILCYGLLSLFINGYKKLTYMKISKFSSLQRYNDFNLYDARKDAMKDEQWKIQQEMLARRKNKPEMKEYFEKVESNRLNLSNKAKETIWAQSKDQVDPLLQWKQAKENGDIKSIGYEPEPVKSDSILGFNVIIPMNPMGIPKYDNGERFDLRLPYAERGYEVP